MSEVKKDRYSQPAKLRMLSGTECSVSSVRRLQWRVERSYSGATPWEWEGVQFNGGDQEDAG